MGGAGSGRRKAIAGAPQRPTAEVGIEEVEAFASQVGQKPTTPPVVYTVDQPSGNQIVVLTKDEKAYYDLQKKQYLADFKFSAGTDLADLDRLLAQELLCFRWNTQLLSDRGYDGRFLLPLEQDQLRRNLAEASKVVSMLKSDLGMTKARRDIDLESPATYIALLQRRAKEFGVHRQKQVITALTLMNTLKSHVGAFDRSNATERKRLGFEQESDIVEWVRHDMIPAFDKVDDEWRKGTQKYWTQM